MASENDANKDWTEMTANIIAIIVIITFAVVIISTSLFIRDRELMAASGGLMAGIVGVILTFYFDQNRIKAVQSQAETATNAERERGQREYSWRMEQIDQIPNTIQAMAVLESENQELIGLMERLRDDKRDIIRAYDEVYEAYEELARSGDTEGETGVD